MLDDHDDHGGLDRDLPFLLERRQALRWMGGVSLAGLLAACGVGGNETTEAETTLSPASSSPVGTVAPSTSAAPTTTAEAPAPSVGDAEAFAEPSAGVEIPDETGGPFPADGTNGPNVLTTDGVFKADLTTSFGDLAGTAVGIPAAFNLTVVDNETGSPLPGAVIYLWHCTADGRYSLYEITDQNFLRGAQVADDAGRVSFNSVFPGCYRGRWPHCHFEVYPSLDGATTGQAAIKTSQLALPQADCEVVYADDRYGPSASNLAQLSLDTDGVFRDGWTEQLAVVTPTGDGYAASLLVRV